MAEARCRDILARMLRILLLLAPLAWSGSPGTCWRIVEEEGRTAYYVTTVENPSVNFEIEYEPKTFGEARNRRDIVTAANGTFFSGPQPLGDVRDSQGREHHPQQRLLSKGVRLIDLGQRWALGRLKQGGFSVMTGDEAVLRMDLYLGGGALLRLNGADQTASNVANPKAFAASFEDAVLEAKRSRTAVGIKTDGAGQALLILHVPPSSGADIHDLARYMEDLGAQDAVMFDGGDAAAYSAGADGAQYLATFPKRDLNPTHIFARACR